MPEDNAEARHAQAQRWRQIIAEAKSQAEPSEGDAGSEQAAPDSASQAPAGPAKKPQSPREFIEQEMAKRDRQSHG